MELILYGFFGLGMLTLIIFLVTGELPGLLRDLTGDYHHDSPAKKAPKERRASPDYDYESDQIIAAQLEHLRCLEQLAKIDICVLNTEAELLDVMAQSQSLQRE